MQLITWVTCLLQSLSRGGVNGPEGRLGTQSNAFTSAAVSPVRVPCSRSLAVIDRQPRPPEGEKPEQIAKRVLDRGAKKGTDLCVQCMGLHVIALHC